ncbi:DUF5706 domain-containing protein [Flavobacteriaceae bacterium F89]|uniref:DUF5706 domain-containing protein n=1 Tax=Cerina litoralis TaxID=2874477 RepID=A0AAE3EUQ4_9FLAO|nr:Pycsar system effector family protein [Cerina litoralis]MCG2459996.1 DUF5706 domain-containing protein [Cerina litoralis]
MSDIIDKAERFSTDLLTHKLDQKYLYHNLTHTKRVVESVGELVEFYKLEGNDKEVLLLAAWLHDTGYIQGSENHEENSCSLAEKFLEEQDYDLLLAQQVCLCIMATKRNHNPQNFLEEIIRDADASHLGKKSFLETSENLREECSLLGLATYTPKEWREGNIKLLQTEHRFYTDYAKENWQPGKDRNLRRMLKVRDAEKQMAKKEALKVKYKDESPERSVQTMFRITTSNHLRLSAIADTKANILLSVNAIIISLALSNLIPKLDNPSNEYLIYPTAIFVFFAIISMALSVLATRPNITQGKFTKEAVDNKKVNLLFFGNFHKMGLEEYQWAMKELLKDKEYVYASLTKDLYFLGKVLDRKYKILRWTYTIFIIGMVISVIAFTIAFKYFVR